jgi:hypothetical protein
MSDPQQPSLAEQADRHWLYQQSVQDVEAEIDFVTETWDALRNRPAVFLREDFCGTAITACEWIRRHSEHVAIGVDLDPEVLAWGTKHNLAELEPSQQERIELLRDDVLTTMPGAADIVIAMNFSYFLFRERQLLRQYFQNVHAGLEDDGVFFLDAYGGYEAPKVLTEPREYDGFTYIWDQSSFNPIDSTMTCLIHFEFPDKSRMDSAFTYEWRLWTLPEIKELLTEVGFAQVDIYWEGTDAETDEGNGVYRPALVGGADPGWVCYIVAQKQAL